jgi:hypothetical protein
MIQHGSVIDYLNEFNMITNQLTYVNVNFYKEYRALLILCSFLERWNSLVVIVSNFLFGSNTLKFDDVVGAILNEEIHRKRLGSTPTSRSVLNVEIMGRTKERGKSSRGHGK